MNSAKIETANLARSIATHTYDTFMVVDAVLSGLRERVATDGTGPKAIARLEEVMRMRVSGQSLIRGLFLLDEHGAWLANSVPGSPRNINYAERDYFRHHRDVADDRALIGPPVYSKVDGSSVVTITHRINHDDGRFAGVLTATISTRVFQNEFRNFDIGDHGNITMTNGDRVILVRRPFAEENVGRDVGESEVFHFVDSSNGKSFEYSSLIDGGKRIGSFRRVPAFDLMIIVSRDKSEVLADWWRDIEVHLTWMAFALTALGLLGWAKILGMQTHARTEALYRLLADNSNDAIICLGRDGRRQYVSPALSAMTGWSEAELLGKPILDIIVPEDRPSVAAAIQDGLDGSPEVAATFRYLCRDGSRLWVEMRSRLTPDPLGGLPIFVVNVRDISRMKAVEEQLAATNAELAAITMTDALTGIANRRHFDQTLLKEWQRAMREASCIALLFVDADYFKNYNDIYGHQRGDACLRTIAQTLFASARRPSDLAARYGGEEFAVILPGLALETAVSMAERMQLALSEQAVEHRGNEASVVTVSIGVAAIVPPLGSQPDVLIKLADEAVYRAKRAGRNRIAVADRDTVPA